MELSSFVTELKSSVNSENYDSLVLSLERLSNLCTTLSDLGSQYDWQNLPYNGYRSIVKLCSLFTINALQPSLESKNFNQESLVGVSKLLIAIAERAIDYHQENEKPFDGSHESLIKSLVKVFTDLKNHLSEVEPHLKHYWGYHTLFWMTSDSRWVPYLFSLVFTLIHKLPKSLLASISKDEYGMIMVSSTWKATVFFPINLANYVNNFISRTYSGLRCIVSGIVSREILVPRQSRWIISDDGSRFTKLYSSSDTDSQKDKYNLYSEQGNVLCHLMRYKSDEPSGDVIIHAQGGGLVVDVRQFHEEYLRDWVQQLNGAVVINVAYSRFVRYPCALQEILDVYLWLIKGDNDVVNALGFKPKRIICLGDSAGSYLLFSLCLIARDIQLISPSEISIYPKALVAISPILSSATPKIFPSFLLSYIDVFLCPSLLLHCFSLYGAGIIFDSDCFDLDNKSENNDSTDSSPSWLKNNYTTATSNFKNFYNTWIKEGKSWYDCDPDIFEARLRKMASRTMIPYISPLVNYDLNTVSDLELYLISTEFDPLLDTNIQLAKSWKGKLTFDVIDQMAHGFCAYYSLSNSCYNASQLCLQRLIEACS